MSTGTTFIYRTAKWPLPCPRRFEGDEPRRAAPRHLLRAVTPQCGVLHSCTFGVDMHIDPALLSPISLFLGALVGGGASLSAPFTRNALTIAFSGSHLRSRNGRPFMPIS
jgi:hypothetical protein